MLVPGDEICYASCQVMVAQGFLCISSSTLCELPVDVVNLLSAQDARIEIGGGGADPGERKLWTRCAAAVTTV